MTNAEKIEAYIKECFECFQINYKEYFYFEFEEGVPEDIIWTNDNGKISMPAVKHASEVLGISVEDILSGNEETRLKWLRKYPFFELVNGYEYACEKAFYKPDFESLRLIECIFDTDLRDQYPYRFDYEDIKRRMIKKLKLQNRIEPGTFHEGATINNLRIATEIFCSYDEIEKMTNSFIKMMENAIGLFLKALHTDLCEDERHEYNLLVSVLGLRDRFYTRGYLYYNQLMKIKEFYKDINEENFSSYIVFKRGLDFEPWRCLEFVNNKDLVQKYLEVVPQAKSAMREYAMKVSRFNCTFTWSDARSVTLPPAEEQMLFDFNASIGEEDIPLEKRAKESSFVNIDKTDEELNGEEKTAEILIGYCRPVKLGGLAIKIPVYNQQDAIKHIEYLFGKVEHNNFVERFVARSEKTGGAGNE